jgi:hypothetical protein
MNIREALLQDKIYTKAQANTITNYACSSPEHFKELMKCFTDNNYRIAQRAAWSVSDGAQRNQELIQPYLKDIVVQLQRTDVHPAVVRNSVRILQSLEMPGELHGEVMNACFGFIEKPATPVAIKAFALTTLYNLSKHYPDIQHELQVIIEERMANETAAFVSRGKKILQQLQKRKTPGV